jgi:hypothetical protein
MVHRRSLAIAGSSLYGYDIVATNLPDEEVRREIGIRDRPA